MWTMNFQMFKLGLETVKEPEIKLQTSIGSSKKQESSKKHLLLLYLLHQSFWVFGSQQSVENSEEMGILGHLTFLLRNLYAGQEAGQDTDMEQQTGSKLRSRLYIVTLLI